MEIITKTGKVKFLEEVAEAYQRLYPIKFEWFKSELAKLRQVTTDGYYAGKSGHMYCKMRVPTELWLFLQHRDPDFGKDSADLELLIRVWSDLVKVRKKDPRVRTTLYLTKEYPRRVNKSRPPRPPRSEKANLETARAIVHSAVIDLARDSS